MQTNRILYTALMLGILAAPLTIAQVPSGVAAPPIQLAGPGPRGPMGPGPGLVGPGGLRGPEAQAMTSLTTLTGSVGQLTANDDGILNGFTLNSSGTPTTVRFGAHMGQQVNAAVKAGNRVTVMGYNQISPLGESIFKLVKLDAGNTQIVDTPPAAPQTPMTPTRRTVTGKVADYQLDREGRANGLILSDQTVVKVPPHVAYQLSTLAPKGSAITVDGYAQPLGDGQVQLRKRAILRASVLTLNGQSYLVQ